MKRLVVAGVLASLGLISSIVLAGSTAFAGESADAKSLRAVALVYRHGVISPKYNPPKVNVKWPMGARQLTYVGIRDMYLRGQELRKKYVEELGFISPDYHSAEVYVRASNTDRSLQTAQMLVFGLFPPRFGDDPSGSGAQVPDKDFVPAPIHSVALENDKVLRPWTKAASCTRYRDYVKSFPRTKLYGEVGQEHEKFLSRVAQLTGVNEGEKSAKILYEINEISEPLSSMKAHNMPFPEGLSEADLDKMSELADWNYHHQFLGKKVGRLTGGPFIADVLRNFDGYVSSGGKSRRFFLYSAHQRTILGIDAALGAETARTEGKLFKGRVPPLGSHYAFELHEPSAGSYAVQVKFMTDDKERIVRIPGCDGDMCPLDGFRGALAESIPDDWRRECRG